MIRTLSSSSLSPPLQPFPLLFLPPERTPRSFYIFFFFFFFFFFFCINPSITPAPPLPSPSSLLHPSPTYIHTYIYSISMASFSIPPSSLRTSSSSSSLSHASSPPPLPPPPEFSPFSPHTFASLSTRNGRNLHHFLLLQGRLRSSRLTLVKSHVLGTKIGLQAESAAPTPAAAPENTYENFSGHSDTFQNVASEADLLLGVRKEVESKRIPPRAGFGMEELYRNYKAAVSEGHTSQETIVQIMSTVLDRVLLQFEEPFIFPSYHKAIREPYDYYTFGQNYIRPLINFRNSFLGNLSRFDEIEEHLKEGHNVVLLANHQTEADPAVMALLLESSHPYISQNLTYIAGDRVVADPFCKPFSMGRNLVCVYSKKHINDEPELVEMKRKANARALKELALLLRKGGQLIWIAPSGGRDRPDSATLKWKPALFDCGSVENMRRLVEHSKAPGHMYPLSLLCYGVMPPPTQVEKEIGEKRNLGFTSVGMSVGAELHYEDMTAGCKSPEEAAERFSQSAWERVNEQYCILSRAVDDSEGAAASTALVTLSQPWTI